MRNPKAEKQDSEDAVMERMNEAQEDDVHAA
jgi:hypothetical protein